MINKKIITLSLLLLSIVSIMGCSTKKTETNPTTTNVNVTNSSCKDAIATYLKQTNKTTEGELVAKGNTVTVDYIGRLDEETVFDTSVESIAKACGKYATGRDYNQGLAFSVGAGQMIAGFDQGVEGMKVGETKTISIEPKDAYGVRDEKNLITVPKEQIPGADTYEVGMQVMASNGQAFKINKIDEKNIILDGNHELAGKTLIFDITVKSVQK